MKRSEIVKIIKESIRDMDFSYCTDEEELEDEAAYLLSQIEKAGMLPPENKQLPLPGDAYLDIHGVVQVKLNRSNHAWEPEDE